MRSWSSHGACVYVACTTGHGRRAGHSWLQHDKSRRGGFTHDALPQLRQARHTASLRPPRAPGAAAAPCVLCPSPHWSPTGPPPAPTYLPGWRRVAQQCYSAPGPTCQQRACGCNSAPAARPRRPHAAAAHGGSEHGGGLLGRSADAMAMHFARAALDAINMQGDQLGTCRGKEESRVRTHQPLEQCSWS